VAFDSIIGQRRVVQFLQASLRSDRIAHSYLFHGPPGVGKFAVAREFAKVLLCPNRTADEACGECASCRQVDELASPSLRVALPGPKEFEPSEERELLDRVARDPYRIEQIVAYPILPIRRIRDLQQFASLSVSPGQRLVVIVALADRMNLEAANAFLKLLEEPPEHLVLILTSSDPGALPQTIASRCQRLRFPAIPSEELETALVQKHGLDPERARLVAGLASGSYGQALSWLAADMAEVRDRSVELLRKALLGLSEIAQYARKLAPKSDRDIRNAALEMLDMLQLWVRDALLLAELGDEARDLIVNQDHLDRLSGFSYRLSEIDFGAIFDAIDEATFQIRRNVAVSIVLAGLMGRFHRAIRR